jgi:DNA-directed RNA polymerase subunit H (RpoH/RPB5)
MAKKLTYDVAKHSLVPKHTILSDKEKASFLKKNNIELHNLPNILITDPAISSLNPNVDDIVKIERKSPTAGKTYYYRRVING